MTRFFDDGGTQWVVLSAAIDNWVPEAEPVAARRVAVP